MSVSGACDRSGEKCGESGKRPGAVRKNAAPADAAFCGENGTGLSGKTEDLTWMQKRCSGMILSYQSISLQGINQWLGFLQRGQALAFGPGVAADLQLRVDLVHILLDAALGKAQLGSDLPVRAAGGD